MQFGRHVVLQGPMVEVLMLVGEEHPEQLAEPSRLREDGLDLRARERGTEPDRERAEVGVATDARPLHRQMRHPVAPLLDRGVSHVRAVADDDLGDRVGECAPEIRRRRSDR